jgi:hypothetical protein
MKKEDGNDGEFHVESDAVEGPREPYSTPRLTQYGAMTDVTRRQQVAEEYKLKLVITGLNQ